MILFNQSLKKTLSNPWFYFIGIGAGLAFTAIYSTFNYITAAKISIIVLLSIIFFSFLIAFITKDKQDVIEIAKRVDSKGKHKSALKILVKARKKAGNDEYGLKIDYEIALVYCSMKQYQQAVDILEKILQKDATEWIWKVYFQLAKALSHTKGYFSDETLDAYLNCVKYKKKNDEYGKDNLKEDIFLCNKISEIYRVNKNYAVSNMWFRDEMLLRKAYCDLSTKNKIRDLLEKAAVLANNNRTEDALRLYEETAYLIENHISIHCDKYAMVQLEMGKLFWKGYEMPRYDLALECFKKSIKIKRKYMSDLSKELSDTFISTLPDMQELCKKSIEDIWRAYIEFQKKRGSCCKSDTNDFQSLVHSKNAVLNKCDEVLELFEEVFQEDSLELAELYSLIGEVYKWSARNYYDCSSGIFYLEKAAKIYRKYENDKSIQTKLATLLVDLGGIYGIQKDYETAMSYRLEALKIIKNVENADLETIGGIELSLKWAYERTAQSKVVDYNSFLENNSLSTIIESVQIQPLGNGWGNFKVKLRGMKEECNLKMTLGSN